MRIRSWMKWSALAVAACGLTGTVLVHRADAAAPVLAQLGGNLPARGRILEKLASLGITEDQKTQIHAILAELKPKAMPLVQQLVAERRALRSLVMNGANETDVRAQAAKVASISADLAVLRAQTAPKIKAVLTPEQQKKLQEMVSQFDQRVDQGIHRAADSSGGAGQE